MANSRPQLGCLQPVILPVFVPETKTKLRALGVAEKFSALSHVLSQTPTQRHAAGFDGKTPKTDDPTGVDRNGTTTNERE